MRALRLFCLLLGLPASAQPTDAELGARSRFAILLWPVPSMACAVAAPF